MLKIQLLGGFEVLSYDEPLEGLYSSGPQTLLTYLLLHREATQQRRHVAFTLWPDSTEKQALTNLRNSLYRLRAALPNPDRYLEVNRKNIAWRSDAEADIDLLRFQEALNSEDWALAVETYQGPLMPAYYHDWLLRWRDRLQDHFLHALQAAIEQQEAAGELRGAVRTARRLLREDPLHEPTYRKLMRLHLRLGDRASAVGAYQTCAEVLRRELEAKVTAETKAALEEVLRQQEADSVMPSRPDLGHQHNLPAPLTQFIGREDTLRLLQDRLRASRLLTLTGPPGVGKTRLAQELARQRLEDFPDGVWWVGLSQLSERDHVLNAVATALEVRTEAVRPLAERLMEFLRTKKLLLVLDNCEHLHAAIQRLTSEWLRHAPEVSILTTTREPLHLAGESVYGVEPLSRPGEGAGVNDIESSEAGRLFVERATELLPTFSLNPENTEAVAEICRRLDGIPLAIELAAGQLRTLTPAELTVRLDDLFRVLGGKRSGGPARQQTLHGTIEWSFQRLSEAEQALLRRLTVFSGGWTLAAAKAVVADGRGSDSPLLSEPDILPTLSGLLEKSQVHVVEREQATRYGMLEIVRQFARERLRETDEGPRAKRAHYEYFAQLAQRSYSELRGPEQFGWLERLRDERDNLRAALGWAEEEGTAIQALTLASDLGPFWSRTDSYREGLRWLDAALRAMDREQDPLLVAQAQIARGNLLYGLGEYEQAASAVAAIRANAVGPESELWLNRAALIEGRLAWRQGDYQQAERSLQPAARKLVQLSDPGSGADAVHILGHILLDRGEIAAAREQFAKSLGLFRELGDTLQVAALTGDQGLVDYFDRDFDAAEKHFRENLETYREVGYRDGIARSLNRLGDLARCRDDYTQAEDLYQRSLELAHRIQHRAHVVSANHNLGYCALAAGDSEAAADWFKRSLQLAEELDDPKGVVDALSGLAAVAADLERSESAVRLFAATEHLRRDLGAHNWPANELETSRRLEALRTSLPAQEFESFQKQGHQMTLEQTQKEAQELFGRPEID